MQWQIGNVHITKIDEVAPEPVPTFSMISGIRPGQATDGYYITDEVWLESSPGHTPGHMSLHIKSEGEEAILAGDVVHHPAQFTHPDWIDIFDSNSSLAASSRMALAAQCADKHIPIIGGHFAAGLMLSENGEWHFAGGDAEHEVR